MNNSHQYNCPACGKERFYSSYISMSHSKSKNRKCYSCSAGKHRIGKHHSDETKKIMSTKKQGSNNPLFGKLVYDRTGCFMSYETKQQMSLSQTTRYFDPNEIEKTSHATKIAMHRPDVRKKHIDALFSSKWIKVKTDKGQLELLNKWNALGFNFEPNYQIHTDLDLFYVDGYDKEKNVVLEYDSKYHKKLNQMEKDLIRQQKIIDILKPNKFWRYDSVNKQCKNVLGKVG